MLSSYTIYYTMYNLKSMIHICSVHQPQVYMQLNKVIMHLSHLNIAVIVLKITYLPKPPILITIPIS
jgi:hypothetical protein